MSNSERMLGREKYSVVPVEITDLLPLEQLPEGSHCPSCRGPVEKAFINWDIPTSPADRK